MWTLRQTWSSNGTTGGQAAVRVSGPLQQSAWYFQSSTGVSTATVRVESAPSSGGPWADEGGSTAVSSGTQVVVRVTGPMEWARPYLGSTGITVVARGIGD